MKPILWLASLRHLKRHPLQMALSILGIALGVAVVVAVDLANESARRAFDLSMQSITGSATHQIIGGPGGLDESLYADLRRQGVAPVSAPLVSGYLAQGDQTLQLLGVDPFAEQQFRNLISYLPDKSQESALPQLLTQPGALLMTAARAASLGLQVGQTFELTISGQQRQALLAGLYQPPQQQAAAMQDLLLADISTAQELLGRIGRLSRIDLILPADGSSIQSAIEAALPAGARLVPVGSRSSAMQEMTRAFGINLTAMSLLALVVGLFLIYNTLSFSVLQRRELLGNLRVLGATRRDIFTLVLGEGVLIGGIGTLLGLLLGVLLAQELLALVTRTINDLYFVLTVSELSLDPIGMAKGALLGLGGTAVAVLAPASEAAMSPPRAVLNRSRVEGSARRLLLPLGMTGVVCILLALLLLLPGHSLILGFFALFILILGFSLFTPAVVAMSCRWAAPLFGRLFGTLGRMAIRGVEASLSRTGVAIAALSIAVSATVGMGVMVDSFRSSVQQWLHTTLQADIYIVPLAPSGTSSETVLDPALITAIEQLPGISEVSQGRPVKLQSATAITRLLAIRMTQKSYAGIELLEGDPETVWPRFDREQVVLISEPYAYRHDLRLGDQIQLETDRGRRAFQVAGVYRDYSSDQGMISMRLSLYRQLWDDESIYSIGLYLQPGVDTATIAGEVAALAAGKQALRIRSTRALLEASLETFDHTFAITRVLRLLVIGVAFIGILSALMALQLERARELAVLRATGLTPGQLWGLVTAQTGFMGLISGLLALPLGLLLATLLIHVINRRAFGWSMDLIVPGGVLLDALLLAVAAALLAGLYPAWRMAQTPPARALREE